MDGLLIKPFKFSELLSVLKNYIEIRKAEKEETNLMPGDRETIEITELADYKQSINAFNEIKSETRRIIKKKSNLDYSLEYFLNTNDNLKDYENFKYNDIVIIKLNIRRAVLKEAQNFYKYIFDLILGGYNNFIVDLNNVEFIDSTFIGVLVSATKRISFVRGDLKLVCDPEVSTFSYIMFDSLKNIFDIYCDIREVIDSFQQQTVN